jgi:processive 1,2-diacylglycerol beta-glucosyltransferase
MEVIIAYASTGAGHFKAAQGLYNYIKTHHPQINLNLVDILEKTNPVFKFFYKHGYSYLVRQARFLWKIAYWTTHFKALRIPTRLIAYIFNCLNTKKFVDFLIRTNPDFIVSTHFFPSEISAYTKKIKDIKFKLITIVTDFSIHPFWVSDGTDIYIVPSQSAKEQLIFDGVSKGNIRIFGIPIDEKFSLPYDRDSLCKRFGIDKDKFTVLILTGSFGIGPIEKIVDLLHKDVQILVVCARNKRLYERLIKKDYSNTKVFGFVDYIQELMAVSDIIITKPGGLGICESLAMELFPIFISPIPGQETENIKVLDSLGIGIYPKDVNEIREIILNFKQSPDKLENVKKIIRKIKMPFAAREISDVICQGGSGFTS